MAMKPRVYIDGKEGTTGLQIYDRLAARDDIELLLIDEEKRKDTGARKELLHAADIVFLCLPDEAAREAVKLSEGSHARIIDASTAHRTADGWAYGFPELSEVHRRAIVEGKYIANPGCHATGFIAAVYPLVSRGILPKDALLSCFSLTGYSGGGKKMIAHYEDFEKEYAINSPGVYGVLQNHKHLPEMKKVCGLAAEPVFCPIVDDYYKGMVTTVPLHGVQLSHRLSLKDLRDVYQEHYGTNHGLVYVGEEAEASTKFYGNEQEDRDSLVLYIAGNEERFTVTAVFDNLGKGASGAAVQNMNLMLGFKETKGLTR